MYLEGFSHIKNLATTVMGFMQFFASTTGRLKIGLGDTNAAHSARYWKMSRQPGTGKSLIATTRAVFIALLMTIANSGNAAECAENSGALATKYSFVDVDGIRIFYREAGDANCPTILLLHGFSSSSHMFRDLFPLLSDKFHLVAPDYPGFGYSDAPPENLFQPDFANLTLVMEKFVQKLELTPFIAYLQDFGGPVGFRLATRNPGWFDGLIIQNANAYTEGLAPQPQGIDDNEDKSGISKQKTSDLVVNSEFIHFLYHYGVRDAAGLNPDAWTVDIAVLQNPEAKRIQAALIDNYPENIPLYSDWQSYLREYQPDTLIAWGRNDSAFLPAGAEAYINDLPDAELKFFETGHFALEEDSIGIANAIVQKFGSKQPGY